MTGDRLYSDHPSHYVIPLPRLEPGLSACQAGVLTARPQRELKLKLFGLFNIHTNPLGHTGTIMISN